jgi:hypothetical protein
MLVVSRWSAPAPSPPLTTSRPPRGGRPKTPKDSKPPGAARPPLRDRATSGAASLSIPPIPLRQTLPQYKDDVDHSQRLLELDRVWRLVRQMSVREGSEDALF